MTGAAMIMAGGQGLRMRNSGVSEPKALVPVAGVRLLERNFQQLVKHGFHRILVAVPEEPAAITAFAEETLVPMGRSLGVALSIHVELRPLGNIGAVRAWAGDPGPLLVVYADNLTALDLRAIRDFHLERSAGLTLAVHHQPFRMPFGEIALEDDRVTAYVEKPTYRIPICSAVSVLSPEAIDSIRPDEALGISDLARRMIAAQAPVLAFEHQAPWADVNEQGDIAPAERMVVENAEAFEHWWPGEPAVEEHLDLAAGGQGKGASFRPRLAVDRYDPALHGVRRRWVSYDPADVSSLHELICAGSASIPDEVR